MQKPKMNNAEKVKCLKTIVQLKRQEEFLDKDIDTFVTRMRVDTDVIQDVIEMRDELSIERNKILNPVCRTGAIILNNLEEIRLVLNDLENGRKIDPEIVEAKLLSLTKKVHEFKLESELDSLVVEQKEREEALLDVTVNINKYEKPMRGMASATCNKSLEQTNLSQPVNFDQFNNFDDLVIKTGHTQRWKEEDHLFFLKIRKKTKSVPMMVTEIRKKFPDLSVEQIINHEAWYRIYIELREKQRKSVESWRRQKEKEKSVKMELLKSNKDKSHEKMTENLENQQMNEYSDRQALDNDNKSGSMKKLSDMKIREQNEKREMIKKWKIERDKVKQAEQERLKNQTEGIRSWKEQNFLVRTIEIKAALDEYKNKKIEEKLTNNHNEKKNQKISRSPALVKSFREKDENYLRKRKFLIISKNEKNNNNKIEKIDEKCPPRSRNESTLFKPTKIWEMRCKQQSTEEPCCKELLYIKNLPRISTFNWKNQESNICL